MQTQPHLAVRHNRGLSVTLAVAVMLVSIVFLTIPAARAQATSQAMKANQLIGRGINLGNALEAPVEGQWGIQLEAGYFDLVADAGFDSIRVPIRWSAQAQQSAPFTINNEFFERIDWVLAQAERTGLLVIINMHHYEELNTDPVAHRARFLSLWNQIASRYRDASERVLFEILNEPQGALNADNGQLWNRYLAQAIRVIRRTNPVRPLIVGPVRYNAIDALDLLQLPDDDNLILTVHFYDPFVFTHQGADWTGLDLPTGIRWYGGQASVGSGFEDWSWDTVIKSAPYGLDVQYQRQYAALSLYTNQAFKPKRLWLRARGRMDVIVECESSTARVDASTLSLNSEEWTTISADLSACAGSMHRLNLKNAANRRDSYTVRHAVVCGNSECLRPITTAARSLYDQLRKGSDFAKARGLPIFLGEFGAFQTADMASRVRWTRSVQRTAQRLGYSTAYWEFAAGFGVYDPLTGQWRRGLRQALLP